jgi:hypothetical protein
MDVRNLAGTTALNALITSTDELRGGARHRSGCSVQGDNEGETVSLITCELRQQKSGRRENGRAREQTCEKFFTVDKKLESENTTSAGAFAGQSNTEPATPPYHFPSRYIRAIISPRFTSCAQEQLWPR